MYKYFVTALLITALLYLLSYLNVFGIASSILDFLVLFLVVFILLNLIDFFFFRSEGFEPGVEVGIRNDADALKQYANNYIARFKFYINSYLTGHPDKNVWYALMRENHREVGRILSKKIGTENSDRIVQGMQALDQTFNDVFSAMRSRNNSYVNTTIQNMRNTSDQVVSVIANAFQIPKDQVARLFNDRNKAILGMGQARVDQEWLTDAQAYTEFQHHVLSLYNLLASRM